MLVMEPRAKQSALSLPQQSPQQQLITDQSSPINPIPITSNPNRPHHVLTLSLFQVAVILGHPESVIRICQSNKRPNLLVKFIASPWLAAGCGMGNDGGDGSGLGGGVSSSSTHSIPYFPSRSPPTHSIQPWPISEQYCKGGLTNYASVGFTPIMIACKFQRWASEGSGLRNQEGDVMIEAMVELYIASILDGTEDADHFECWCK